MTPLIRRLLRELRHNLGKYLGIFLLMCGSIALTSGFLLAAHSIGCLIDNMRDDIAVPSDAGRMVKSVFRMAIIKYAPWDLKAAGYRLQSEVQRFRASKNGGDYAPHTPTGEFLPGPGSQ